MSAVPSNWARSAWVCAFESGHSGRRRLAQRTNHHAVRADGSTEHMVAGRERLGMHAQKAKSAEAYRNSLSIS